MPWKNVPFFLSFTEKALFLRRLSKEMEITSKEPSLFYPTQVLVWRLEEEAPRLLALCREVGIAVEDLETLPVKRQREKAAERLLLRRAFGRPVVLSHTGQGAPMVEGCDVNISISHTMRLVVLAVDERRVIGIDAEHVDRQQVLRVRDKFLNDSEKQFIASDDLDAHIIAWTAKEAVIKATRNCAIDWTGGITIQPFDAGLRPLDFHATCGSRRYRLFSCLLDGHYVTVTVPL